MPRKKLNQPQQLRKLAAHPGIYVRKERIRIGQWNTWWTGAAAWPLRWMRYGSKKLRQKQNNSGAKRKIYLRCWKPVTSLERILNEPSPVRWMKKDLAAAVLWLGRQFTNATEIPVEFSNSTNNIKIPGSYHQPVQGVPGSADQYYHVMQKPAPWTLGGGERNNIILRIQDNGKGFEISSARSKGFGILGMEERAIALGSGFYWKQRLEKHSHYGYSSAGKSLVRSSLMFSPSFHFPPHRCAGWRFGSNNKLKQSHHWYADGAPRPWAQSVHFHFTEVH